MFNEAIFDILNSRILIFFQLTIYCGIIHRLAAMSGEIPRNATQHSHNYFFCGKRWSSRAPFS